MVMLGSKRLELFACAQLRCLMDGGFKRGSSDSESKQDGLELGFFVAFARSYPKLELELSPPQLRHSLQTSTTNKRTSLDGGKILKGEPTKLPDQKRLSRHAQGWLRARQKSKRIDSKGIGNSYTYEFV